jgi:hypothetical protein
MNPKEGWELAAVILGDSRRPFPQRFAVHRAVQFLYGCKKDQYRQEMLRCLARMIPDSIFADFAIEDLRQWKCWELTGLVLAQYGKESHSAPITQRSIIRYALCCPLAEARQFVERVRRQEPDLLRDQEEGLEFERQK